MHALQNHAYRFYISTDDIGVSYEKKWRSQLETSIRLIYPALGGHITQAVLACLTLGLMIVPFVWMPTFFFLEWQLSHTIALVVAIGLIVVYTCYTTRVWRAGWLVGGIVFPFVLIQELWLLVRSVYAYTTRTVTWKGRPIIGSAKDVTRSILRP